MHLESLIMLGVCVLMGVYLFYAMTLAHGWVSGFRVAFRGGLVSVIQRRV